MPYCQCTVHSSRTKVNDGDDDRHRHDGAIEATVVLLSTYDGAVVEGGMTLQLAAEGTMAPGGQILSSGWQTASGLWVVVNEADRTYEVDVLPKATMRSPVVPSSPPTLCQSTPPPDDAAGARNVQPRNGCMLVACTPRLLDLPRLCIKEPEHHAFASGKTHELAGQLVGFAEAGRVPRRRQHQHQRRNTRGAVLLHHVTAVPSTVADVPSTTAALP
ncbi:hypothetical protein BJ912DRAFT_934476 [Pholiota molesta]|nr:hypothetical protein BJ912DRAFT_934476 [Pholiota molesta]